MKVFINTFKGFRNVYQVKRLVIILFLLNLIFSLLLAVPMYHSLRDSFGAGTTADNMLNSFDYLWWEEFRDQNEDLETTFTPAIIGKGALLTNLEHLTTFRFLSLPPVYLIFGFIYILFHTFLAGGILSVLNPENPGFSLRLFFSGAGNFFISFIIYMILFWFFLFVLIGSVNSWFHQILSRISRNAYSEIMPFFFELASSAVVLFLIFFFHMVFDYARIKTVLTDRKTVLKNTVSAFKFVMKNLGSTLGLYYCIGATALLFSIVYIGLASLIIQSNLLWITMGFLVQQLFIFGIIWIRCWLYAGEMELYRYI